VHQPFAGGAREWAQRLWRTQDGRAVSPLLDLYLRTGESQCGVEGRHGGHGLYAPMAIEL
jgi:hypothetical protein